MLNQEVNIMLLEYLEDLHILWNLKVLSWVELEQDFLMNLDRN